MLQVLDTISEPGHPDKPNEDAFGHGAAHAWVIDGATGVADSELVDERSDARWLAQMASGFFSAHTGAYGRDLHGLTTAAIREFAARFEAERRRAPNGRYELPCASMALLHTDGSTLSCATFGDCGLILLGDDGTIAQFGDARGESTPEAQRRITELMADVDPDDDARKSPAVLRYLRAARNRQNTDGAYWNLGLEPKAADHMKHWTSPVTVPTTGLLTTDGFVALAHDYKRLTPADLVIRAREEGLAALVAEIRKVEHEEDPNVRIYPRFKRSDDATAVLFRMVPGRPG